MGDEQDSWFKPFGFDPGKAAKEIFDKGEAVVEAGVKEVKEDFNKAKGFVEDKIDKGEKAIKSIVSPSAPSPKPAASAGGSSGGASSPSSLGGSVGRGGKNNPEDVKGIQRALGITDDGKCGPATIKAIEDFQRSLGQAKPDGRIDPGGPTSRALAGGSSGGISAKLPQLKKDADDAVDDLTEEAAEKLKEAGRLIEDLAIKVKDFGVAIAKDTEGCRLQAAAIAVAVVASSAGLAAVIFPAPADVTPAVVVAGPIQITGGVAAFLGVVGLLSAITAYTSCKVDQLETLNKEAKEAARDRDNAELKEKVKKLEKQQQQIDDVNNRKQDLQNSLNQIRKFVK